MPTRTLFILLAACAFNGCHIKRDRVNPHVRHIDTSWIKPGVTTKRQIIDRIGIPPAVQGHGGVTPDTFRWTLLDTRTGTLEAGYIVTPTFELSRAHLAEDILVKFHEDDTVALLSRTISDGTTARILEWKESGR